MGAGGVWGGGEGVVRCELEVGDSHNFPPNPGHGVTSHRIEAQEGRLSELPETLERGGAGSALLPISPGILSHRFTVSWLAVRDLSTRFPRLTSPFPEFFPFK